MVDPITLTLVVGKFVLGHLGVHVASTAATTAVGAATLAAGVGAVIYISYLTYQKVMNSLRNRAANKRRDKYKAIGSPIVGDITSGNVKVVPSGIWGNRTSTKGYLTGFVNMETKELDDIEIIECDDLDSDLKRIHRDDAVVIYD